MVRNQESHYACTQMANDEESPFETGKILIRDLAPSTTGYDLNRYFMQYAEVTRAIIPHNSVTGNPHSFGFVVFAYPFRIPFILQLPHCIHDRCVEVSRALKGEDLQTLESQRMITTGDIVERLGVFDERNIFTQGSPCSGITNDEFLKYFQGFGNVIHCYFWDDIGYGHIHFRIKRSADRVMYRRFCILNGKRLKVYRLQRLPLDHNDARNPNVSRAINIQEEAAASSGGDHVNGTRDMQPQAATSVSNTRNTQIFPAAGGSGTDHVNSASDMRPQAVASVSDTRDMQIFPAAAGSGTDHVNSASDMRPQAAASVSDTRDMQIAPGAASSGTDHRNGIRDMQSQAAASVSDTRNRQIFPAAASSGGDHVNSTTDMQPQAAESDSNTRDMQIIPAAASCDNRNMHIIPAAASSRTGHPWNNSPHNHRWRNVSNVGHVSALGIPNFPPRQQIMPHYRPQMNYMVPGVFRFPGHRPDLYQPYNRGMVIYTNAANNFPGAGVASFPGNYAGFGNFPMPPTGYSNQDYFYDDNTYQYYPPTGYSNQDYFYDDNTYQYY